MMTISQFSQETGLSPKTLRYYEEVGVLVPAFRQENGYRQYSLEQVEVAQLIHSLRQAEMKLADIHKFLQASPEQREKILSVWKEKMATRMLSIQVASQFLNGLDVKKSYIQLLHWEQERSMIWYPLATDGSTIFAEIKRYSKELKKLNVKYEPAAYTSYRQADNEQQGELGFIIEGKIPKSLKDKVSAYPSTLFATLKCRYDMPLPCKPIFANFQQFGFQLVGNPLRKNNIHTDNGYYTLMVPVVNYNL